MTRGRKNAAEKPPKAAIQSSPASVTTSDDPGVTPSDIRRTAAPIARAYIAQIAGVAVSG
jgi:hypothetical protein